MIFYFGNYLLGILYSGAGGVEIKRVYDFKQNASDLRILILMLLIIGPGEELFLEGGVCSAKVRNKKRKKSGLVLATALYTVVHIFTGNIILLIAALTCGIFLGGMALSKVSFNDYKYDKSFIMGRHGFYHTSLWMIIV